jgi:hypothetical protein
MPFRSKNGVARYGLPGLVLGLAIASAGDGGRGPAARAQPPPATERARMMPPAGEASGTLAFTSPAGGTAQLLYLVDTKTRAFAIYRVDPANPKGTVKLEAARQYAFDLRLAQYNNQPPEVTAIESMVRTQGPSNR